MKRPYAIGLAAIWLALWVYEALRGDVSRYWLSALVLVNGLTFGAYALDKWKAQRGAWRVSEFTLHQLELLGGWPTALFAQMYLRHKSSKWLYRIQFYAIVAANLGALILYCVGHWFVPEAPSGLLSAILAVPLWLRLVALVLVVNGVNQAVARFGGPTSGGRLR